MFVSATMPQKIRGNHFHFHKFEKFSFLHGKAKLPHRYVRGNVLRPFLTTPKTEFISWCERHNVTWSEDISNKDTNYTRNYIRHELMPHALKVNPGLRTTIKKIIERGG
jgi:tRNA(Ile)-lysidine synthase TilS/MesJ